MATVGEFAGFCAKTAKALPRRPFQWSELVKQAWFIASVSILPAALVAIPFGAVIALQLGSLSKQIGAESFAGAASVLAVVREAGPIVTALIIAGAGGSAMCADLGSRKIREELDAMETLGVDPVQRLVVPRVIAGALVGFLLNGVVSSVGIAGGYLFNVFMQDGTPGSYLASFAALGQVADLVSAQARAFVFGIIAALIACYLGMNAKGGPKGVGQAVNTSVVVSFMVLFAVNFVMVALYFQIIPQKGS
ncbi:MlaE family ABC transporter permease [Stackebrandtia soli]|uniref:MlaE family ABC transporter permease n=1 Tax=Stackebrandtia soli TaxID=1892856 RepID=UPI0039E9CE9E